jgi:hypothetical protein
MAIVLVNIEPFNGVDAEELVKVKVRLDAWDSSAINNAKKRQEEYLKEHLDAVYELYLQNNLLAKKFVEKYPALFTTIAANYAKPVRTSSHSGSSTSTTSSGHTGSSSSQSTSTTTSSSATNTTHADSNGGSTTTATSAIKEINPYLPIKSHTGKDSFKETSLDPTAGSWTFRFNDGTEITIDDYDKALIVEAALTTQGKGPRPGAQAYAFSSLPGVELSYEDAALYYRQELQEEVARLNTIAEQRGSAKLDLDFAEDAYAAALAAQQYDGNIDYDTVNMSSAKKSSKNWLWWLLGGAAVLGIGVYVARKNKKRR